jgi:hypothetical protein
MENKHTNKASKTTRTMTPKEKAKELVERYINLYPHQREDYLNNEDAELCALIAVDEILLVLNQLTLEYEYWQQVKQEIFKL